MHTEQTKRYGSVRSKLLTCAAVLLSAFALTSCTTLNLLSRDVRSMKKDQAVVGRITGSGDRRVKVYVLKRSADARGYTVADSASPNGLGDFAFLLPGRKPYFLAAVEDSASSRKQTAARRVSIYGNMEMQELPVSKRAGADPVILDLARQMDLKSPAAETLDRALDSWKPGQPGTSGSIPIGCGEVVTLNDPCFDPEAGLKGLWAPVTSAKRHGVGVYFLEPYSPRKIPVLFVHGMGGTPRSWKPLIDSLDRSRYQPWIYSYPSGLPLETTSKGLADLTDRLQRHYHFKKLHVVAHSMGGLVARSGVQTICNEMGGRYISSLTTISTPWNGVLFTVIGTLGMPAPVPAWFDLRPNSKFIRKALADPLPVPHLLVSTEKSRFNITLPRLNDGTVSVASQLDPRAVSRASSTLVVHENHTRVLEVPQTQEALQGFLKSVR